MLPLSVYRRADRPGLGRPTRRSPYKRAALSAVPSRRRRASRRATPSRDIVVPKVEGPGDLAFIERLLDGTEAATTHSVSIRMQALIETAAGLANVKAIAATTSRLDALILGYADLAASLGRTRRLAFAGLPCQSGRQDLNLRPPGPQPERNSYMGRDSAL